MVFLDINSISHILIPMWIFLDVKLNISFFFDVFILIFPPFFGYQLYFWRTKNGLEVDFILYGPEGLIAIEIKRSRHVQSKDLRGLKEFKKDYPPARCYLFYGGSTPLFIDDIPVLPIEQALRNLDQLLRPS